MIFAATEGYDLFSGMVILLLFLCVNKVNSVIHPLMKKEIQRRLIKMIPLNMKFYNNSTMMSQ
jgi:hypothetical protein